MAARVLEADEVAKWSGSTTDDSGAEPFECGPTVNPKASTMQTVMAQNGPILEASSGVCLLIPIYVPKFRIGLIVHLAREFGLSEEGEDLISRPFARYPQIKDHPIVRFVSSSEIAKEYAGQIEATTVLIKRIAKTPVFRDILVKSSNVDDTDPMSVDLLLYTSTGKLRIEDGYGQNHTVDLSVKKSRQSRKRRGGK